MRKAFREHFHLGNFFVWPHKNARVGVGLAPCFHLHLHLQRVAMTMERKIYPHHTSYLKKLHLHTQHEITRVHVSVNHNDLQFPNVSLKQKHALS